VRREGPKSSALVSEVGSKMIVCVPKSVASVETQTMPVMAENV